MQHTHNRSHHFHVLLYMQLIVLRNFRDQGGSGLRKGLKIRRFFKVHMGFNVKQMVLLKLWGDSFKVPLEH